LGQRTHVDKIEIRWPGGIIQQVKDIPCNQTITITERN